MLAFKRIFKQINQPRYLFFGYHNKYLFSLNQKPNLYALLELTSDATPK